MSKKEKYHYISEGGGFLSIETESGYDLYEIPQYGGEPRFIQYCKDKIELEDRLMYFNSKYT